MDESYSGKSEADLGWLFTRRTGFAQKSPLFRKRSIAAQGGKINVEAQPRIQMPWHSNLKPPHSITTNRTACASLDALQSGMPMASGGVVCGRNL